jgi:hypothetical protein
VYDLYAVTNHLGGSGAGHYIAYVKAQHDQQWYCFDDESTREMDESAVQSASAYLLFYMRRDVAAAAGEWLDRASWGFAPEHRRALLAFPGSDGHARALAEARSSRQRLASECVIL